jgi:hypothetical protein
MGTWAYVPDGGSDSRKNSNVPSVWVFLGEADQGRAGEMRRLPLAVLEQAAKAENGGQVKTRKKILGRVPPRGVYVEDGFIVTRLPVNGKRVKKSFGNVKDPDALNALAAAIRAANRFHDDRRLGRQGLERPSEHITIEKACEIYWEHHASKKPTAKDYARALGNFKKFFGNRALDSLTYLDVQAYRAEREKAGLMPTSINREHTILT